MFLTYTYADFKLVAAQFTSGKVFVFNNGSTLFKVWGMASGFPVLVLSLQTKPGTFDADFPGAIVLSQPLTTDIG